MKKDLIINFFITIGISLTLFLVNKYFALYLGAENLGLMKLFTQMLAYLNLAEIGLTSASAYALYGPLARKDYKQISIILTTINSLYNKILLFILVVGLGLNPIIPFFIKNKVINKFVYVYWSFYVISTSLSYVFIKYSVLFTADQKYGFVRLIEGGSRICCQVIQIFVIVKYKSFFWFILLLIFNNIVQYVIYKIYYKKHYKYIKKTQEKEKSITTSLKNLFWHRLAGLVVFNTDLILISKFISLEMVGIYASYLMVIQMISTILNILLNVLKPKIGNFIVEHDKDEIFDYFRNLNVIFLGVAIIFTLCTYELIDDFIVLWLGVKFVLPKITVTLIMINLFILIFRAIIDIFKETGGFFDDIYLPISEATINFIISIVLVHYIGLNGVIIGTIFSNILIICIAKPILVFKKIFNRDIKIYIEIYANYLKSIIFSLISIETIMRMINLNSSKVWLEWILKGSIVLCICVIITIIIFLYNSEFKHCIKNIKKELKP